MKMDIAAGMNNNESKTGAFWSSLHPFTFFVYLILFITAAVAVNHPLVLGAVFLSVIAAVASTAGLKRWLENVKIFLWMIVIFSFINIVGNNDGSTVLISFHSVPLLGGINLSLENIVFSLVMGLRLLVIYSLFILYNRAMDSDAFLAIFARFFPRSGIMAAMAAKSMPAIAGRLERIWETQRLRGVNLGRGKGRIAAVRNRIPLLRALLYSVLEDSFNMGESIQSRAYGSGPRTSYNRRFFERRDFLTLSFLAAAVICFYLIFSMGWAMMAFFPTLSFEPLSTEQLFTVGAASFFLGAPALISRGYDKWDFLKWKI